MATTYAPPPGPPPGFHTGVQYAPPRGPPPQMYTPPPGPPPVQNLSCQNATELSAYVRNSLPILASCGYLAIPLPPDLEPIYANLFAESATFFDLPSDAQAKTAHAAPTGKSASDEGFSDIVGEKQLITIRRVSGTPSQLCPAAKEAWNTTGELFFDTIHAIAESLELPDLGIFDPMSAEAHGLPTSTRASSLLRLFRYNRPEGGGGKKVVAEAHKDLGLLTLVVGQSPGLDARDPATGKWVSVEDAPPGTPGRLTATLLAGQSLTYLTRGLYASGVHRVSVLPPSLPDDKYRFSLVFALRPAPAALIDTDEFAKSPLIGPFPPAPLSLAANNFPNCSMHKKPAADLFQCIANQHWNVNIAPEEREKQKKRLERELEEKRVAEQAGVGDGESAAAAESTEAKVDESTGMNAADTSFAPGERRLG
ncbi:hypothetical protein C8R43DRAFT_1007596 [Mycena crocata]|nr:hypothetical protein C8R43DRAFT_1007596 [Mycena crocata]